MVAYLWNSHSLSFNNTYDEIQVIEDASNDVVQTYSLTGDIPLKIEKSDAVNAWLVGYTSCNNCHDLSLHKYDTLGGASFFFEEDVALPRLGGIGLVDLRDIGRSGNYNVSYDLSRGPVYIQYVGGPLATHISFPELYTYEEDNSSE